MIFSGSVTQNSRVAKDQWDAVQFARNAANNQEKEHIRIQRLMANQGLIPRDVYQDFDNVTVERFREDDGDTFLNDLLPLSRSVNIGKLVSKFRQASDAGNSQTSMSGQIGIKLDQVDYSYDGALVPIHDTGFGRSWREWEAMNSEGFDGLIDDQRESVASLRQRLADNFLDGHTDVSGNPIVVDNISWQGMRNDSRVASVNLGAGGINFDFTDPAATGEQIKAAFLQIRDVLWIDNKCGRDVTYYISKAIASNFERKFSTQYDAKIIMQELASLMGVAAIKVTSKLEGNELMGFVVDRSFVQPVVGMGINTVAMPRPNYNSDYMFAVWGAIGFSVRTDFSGNTCAVFAQDLG